MNKWCVIGPTFLVAGIIAFFFSTTLFAQELLVVNPALSVNSLSSSEVKNIFLGKMTSWPNGEHVEMVVQKEGDAHENFLSHTIGMTSVAFRNYWRKQVFAGTGRPPETLQTDSEVVRYVASRPGAVGYIGHGSPHDGVKVLSISQ